MVDWKEIHDDVLFEIQKRLITIEDCKSFGSVCRSWRASNIKDKDNLKQKKFRTPRYILAEEESGTHKIFNASTGNTHEIAIPEASQKYILTNQDWLLIIGKDKNQTSCLLHLVSRIQIPLPFPPVEVNSSPPLMFVLSVNPNLTSDFTVVVIWCDSFRLAFWKPGNTSWTLIDDWVGGVHQIYYWNNNLYGVGYWGWMLRCDVHGPEPTKLLPLFDLSELFDPEILIVDHYINKVLIVSRRHQFKVYEVNIEDGTWVEISDLGNKAILLCMYGSIECTKYNGFKPNCIYFANRDVRPRILYWDKDVGRYLCDTNHKMMYVYHLSNGMAEPFNEEIETGKLIQQTRILQTGKFDESSNGEMTTYGDWS